MAKKTGKPEFASLNPGDMLQGGLPTDFRGVIVAAKYHKFDYNGSIETPVLAVELTIQPHEDSELTEPVVQSWAAGDLKSWAPADSDGDVAEEGPYAVKVGKRAEMNSNTNFAHLMETILESGAAAKGKPFTEKQLQPSVECLVGLDAHWDRVPQKKRKGMTDRLNTEEGEEGEAPKKTSNKDILVVTEVFGYDPDGAEAPAPAKKAKTTKPADDDDDDQTDDADEPADDDDDANPLDAELNKLIKAEIKKAGGSLKKGKLATIVLKAFGTDKRKNKLVSRAAEEEFLSAGPWEFDEDTGILSI